MFNATTFSAFNMVSLDLILHIGLVMCTIADCTSNGKIENETEQRSNTDRVPKGRKKRLRTFTFIQ